MGNNETPSFLYIKYNAESSGGIGTNILIYQMPIFRIIVTSTRTAGNQRIDRGLYVDIQTNSFANPITSNKEQVANAFLYQRGVDIKKMGALNTSCLKATRIG